MPSHRYRDVFGRVAVPLTPAERAWPERSFTAAPLWVPVDLRDGNQALAEPMDTPRKRRMFDLFVGLGYKEIEVAYPSASRTDFDFVRSLAAAAAAGVVPEDVTVSVFTPTRPELIERTFESVVGLPNVLVHLYTATAPAWRDVVLRRTRAEVLALVEDAAEQVARLADRHRGRIRMEFSPEVFTLTEPDFVLEVCDRVTEVWDACADRPVVHNLPATVEVATPNVYADQIEYMHRHLARREHVILSVHPHNDRGTGVACAELAVLAGAQRVEGCLFGNGERTGNVDLVTLALNLHAQGVDPMVDFSDIDRVRGVAYVLRTTHGVDLPKDFQPLFSRVVQQVTDAEGRELSRRTCGPCSRPPTWPAPPRPGVRPRSGCCDAGAVGEPRAGRDADRVHPVPRGRPRRLGRAARVAARAGKE